MGNKPTSSSSPSSSSGARDSQVGPSSENAKRERICAELLETEETYVRGLTTLDRYYRTALLESGLDQGDCNAIFSSLPDILSLHYSQMLPKLQLRCTPQAPKKTRWCVAAVFMEFAEYVFYIFILFLKFLFIYLFIYFVFCFFKKKKKTNKYYF